jgi:hypothetical protein
MGQFIALLRAVLPRIAEELQEGGLDLHRISGFAGKQAVPAGAKAPNLFGLKRRG